jgi:hypothetical protein
MMEKYLLSKNPFPTEPELLAVIVDIFSWYSCLLTNDDAGIGDRAVVAKSMCAGKGGG